MTALAGVVGLPQEKSEEFCKAALAAQSLYGRDAPSIRTVETAGFGIRAYATLPTERVTSRPLANERFLFVADIRCDNRVELAAAIGIDVGPTPDVELLFAAWQRWGVGALGRIAGDFALAVFDLHRRELTLARDPSGQRSLFFLSEKDHIAFASMPSGLLAGLRAEPDLQRIAQLLARQGAHDRRSCFRRVERLLPGEAVVLGNGLRRSIRYWQPRLDSFEGRGTDDLTEEYRSLIDLAVEARLPRASGPLATHLSSGLDSSAITTTAARLSQDRNQIIAFTAAPAFDEIGTGPYGRPTDESPIAAETAKQCGIEHVVVRNADALLAVVRDYARYYQEPVRNVLNMGWWIEINRLAELKGATTMLTAEMGNTTLNAGELSFLFEWVRRWQWAMWWREARAVMRCKGASWRGVAVASFGPWLPLPLTLWLERIYGAYPSWTEQFFSDSLLDSSDGDNEVTQKGQAAERLDRFTAIDFGPLRKGCLAQSGIDQRDPMADRRIAEFGLRLPPEQMMHNGFFCPLARRALADRVPKIVLDLPLRGYQGGDWTRRLRRPDVAAIVEEIAPSSAAQELLNFNRLRKALNDWPNLSPSSNADLVFGRDLTAALAAGVFVAEVERYPHELGC